MIKVLVIGHTGFIGNSVFKQLIGRSDIIVTGINSTSSVDGGQFDVVINCAGTSKRIYTERHPMESLQYESGVIWTLSKIQSLNLIHISSICAKDPGISKYGQLKTLVESEVREMFTNVLILRVGGLVGNGLKKNIIFDVMNGKSLPVTRNSTYNFISTSDLAKIIEINLNHVQSLVLGVGGIGEISAEEIVGLSGQSNINYGTVEEHFSVDVSKLGMMFPIKRSFDYIKEFFDDSRIK